MLYFLAANVTVGRAMDDGRVSFLSSTQASYPSVFCSWLCNRRCSIRNQSTEPSATQIFSDTLDRYVGIEFETATNVVAERPFSDPHTRILIKGYMLEEYRKTKKTEGAKSEDIWDENEWNVTTDSTVENTDDYALELKTRTKEDRAFYPLEMISPPTKDIGQIADVHKSLFHSEKIGAVPNASASTHVHVNAIKGNPNLKHGNPDTPLTAAEIANVYLRYMEFEKVIQQMLPLDRRTNRWCKPLDLVNPLCSRMFDNFFLRNPQLAKDANGDSYLPGLRYNYGEKAFTLNLMHLTSGSHGTLEFRGYGATRDTQQIEMWVRFLVFFVDLFGSRTDVLKRYQEMISAEEEGFFAGLPEARAAMTSNQNRYLAGLAKNIQNDSKSTTEGCLQELFDPLREACKEKYSSGDKRILELNELQRYWQRRVKILRDEQTKKH